MNQKHCKIARAPYSWSRSSLSWWEYGRNKQLIVTRLATSIYTIYQFLIYNDDKNIDALYLLLFWCLEITGIEPKLHIFLYLMSVQPTFEPPHDKTNKLWLCAQRRLRSAWASAQSDQSLRSPHEESLGPYQPIERTAKTDQTGWMPRLIWVFAGHTATLLVLSWGGSFM